MTYEVGKVLPKGWGQDTFSANARDYVRLAVFAGFDAQELVLRCFKRSRGDRVFLPTVERVLGEMEQEDR